MNIRTGMIIVAIVTGLTGCHDSSPSAPSTFSIPTAQPPAPNPQTGLVTFRDPASGFLTTDLRDAQDQIFRLSTTNEFIEAAANIRLPGYRLSGSPVDSEQYIEGRICSNPCTFVVRFGMVNGERRAYLTVDYGHDNPGTIVDVEVVGAGLVVTQTNLYPPGSPTLSGVVTEATSSGPRPVAGVDVYRGVITGWRKATTDSNGFYEIRGLLNNDEEVSTFKQGYQNTTARLTMSGDTRFDISIVRQ